MLSHSGSCQSNSQLLPFSGWSSWTSANTLGALRFLYVEQVVGKRTKLLAQGSKE